MKICFDVRVSDHVKVSIMTHKFLHVRLIEKYITQIKNLQIYTIYTKKPFVFIYMY